MMKASGVRPMPRSFAGPLSSCRFASSVVISARSCCVTCGRLIQLACKRGPAIFWIRVSGWTSISPNLAKSTTGVFGSAAPAGPAVCPVSMALTNALISSCKTRLLSPEPVTWTRLTPSSRASLRTDGLAWAFEKPASSMAAGARLAGDGAGVGARLAGESSSPARRAPTDSATGGAPTDSAATASIRAIDVPPDTVSPTLTKTVSIVPATTAGTSIAALSVSSVTSESSTSTLEPEAM